MKLHTKLYKIAAHTHIYRITIFATSYNSLRFSMLMKDFYSSFSLIKSVKDGIDGNFRRWSENYGSKHKNIYSSKS